MSAFQSPDLRPLCIVLILGWSIVVTTAGPVGAWSGGMAVDGIDMTRALPPAGAQVADYRNAGYRMVVDGDEARVFVETTPLQSRSKFSPPEAQREAEPLARLARTLVLGASTEYEAISRILSWVARNIEYRLDRQESQEAGDVLRRRTAYCTGIARLSVSLLRAAGLEAREVAGFVYSDGTEGPQGFHRWVEAKLQDVGWIYSDPLYSHHYVPATYLRIDSEQLLPDKGIDGVLVERRDQIVGVDLSPVAGPGIRIRRNSPRRLAAALQVSVESAGPGLAVLEGRSNRFRHQLVGGQTTFLGLEPGSYRLQIMLVGQGMVERHVEVVGRQRSEITLAASVSGRPGNGADSTLEGKE